MRTHHIRTSYGEYIHFHVPWTVRWLLPTAYAVREEVIFSVCLSVHIWGGGGYPIWLMGGGYPIQVQVGGGYPIQVQVGGAPAWGTPWQGMPTQGTPPQGGHPPRVPPHPGLGGGPTQGTPPPPPSRSSSIACSCYAAVGMPLAFTQEDFLVRLKSSDGFPWSDQRR